MRRAINRTAMVWLVCGGVLGYFLLIALGCQAVAGLGRDISTAADGVAKMGEKRNVYPTN